MAIEKNSFKGSRLDPDFSPNSRDTVSNDEDDEEEVQRRGAGVSGAESDDVGVDNDGDGGGGGGGGEDDDDEFDDADSGAGSDDFDLLELGETGAEFCQIGNLTCSVPFELYDLSGLQGILSVDVWNDVLSEEERFNLTKFLPDLDQFTFMRTLKELFEGQNFNFGSPIKRLFEMLKGGLCEPRVALYRDGLNFFQKRQHYHLLRKHQNKMVANLCQIRDAWFNCRGYSIEEKLRVLNIMKSEKSLMYEKMDEDLESDSSRKDEIGDGLWSKMGKDRKNALKAGRNSGYGVGVNPEFSSRMPSAGLEVTKYVKQNPKGTLKVAGSKNLTPEEMTGHLPSVCQGLDANFGAYGMPPISRQKAMMYDSGAALRLRDQMRADDDNDDDDAEDPMYGMGLGMQRGYSRVTGKSGALKSGKRHDFLRNEELRNDGFMGFPLSSKNNLHAYGRNRNVNLLSEVKRTTAKPTNIRASREFGKKSKYPDNIHQFAVGDQMKSLKGRTHKLPLKGTSGDLSEYGEQFWHGKNQGLAFPVDSSLRSDDGSMRSKKRKTGKDSPDLNFRTYGSSSPQLNDTILLSELRTKPSREKMRANFMQNGGPDKGAKKFKRLSANYEETESESSDQFDDDDGNIKTMRSKKKYPSGTMEGSRTLLSKSGIDARKGKFAKRDMKQTTFASDGLTDFSRKGFTEFGDVPEYSIKTKQKGKMHESDSLPSSGVGVYENSSPYMLGKVKDENDRKRSRKSGKNGHFRESGEGLYMSSLRSYTSERKHEEVGYDIDEEDDSLETRLLADESVLGRFGKKGRDGDVYLHDRRYRSDSAYPGFNTMTKKLKAKEELADADGRDDFHLQKQTDDFVPMKKKGKRRVDADAASTLDVEIPEPPVAEPEAAELDLETKPQKKPYTPITPTVHTGFSFSIIHLLSAIRLAMVTPLPEDSLEVGKSGEEQNEKHKGDANGVVNHENAEANKSDAAQINVPSLTVQEIVNRVRSNPGDPCILETQEPLQDLVRGVLKIFSSKTAPLGAKGWKALVVYERSTKSWSWIGPVSHSSTDHETMEEVTSPEYWGLPHKMLIKLVDSFANWLKSGQETLQQIGSLPAPPVSLMQCNLDEKERFKDLRAQKSLNTISPSSEEVREYFRKEEVLRYSIPDRAFSYTAADGKKSIVAPLRRCGGKPTSKARDHFMLKRDRPPHVTILCLVRDAASRLPGSIGTRADVCTLIRDSQYIVEDVSDAQVNQVVSGALDRLHYERDPCVQFDGERKLWVYLHREREEEDFEDDGTSSTKKWKRQKKDPADQQEQGAVTVAFHGNDQSGVALGSDLNTVPPPVPADDKRTDPSCDDVKQMNAEASHVSDQTNTHQDHPMVWDGATYNPVPENRLLCQENSTNEDFDDETFGGETS